MTLVKVAIIKNENFLISLSVTLKIYFLKQFLPRLFCHTRYRYVKMLCIMFDHYKLYLMFMKLSWAPGFLQESFWASLTWLPGVQIKEGRS